MKMSWQIKLFVLVTRNVRKSSVFPKQCGCLKYLNKMLSITFFLILLDAAGLRKVLLFKQTLLTSAWIFRM